MNLIVIKNKNNLLQNDMQDAYHTIVAGLIIQGFTSTDLEIAGDFDWP